MKYFLVVLFCAISLAALGNTGSDFVGNWETKQSQATLYREDRTVDYRDCFVSLKIQSAETLSPDNLKLNISELRLQCTHPKYWDFKTFFGTAVVLGQLFPNQIFKSKTDLDGVIDFIDIKKVEGNLSLDWSRRSYEDLNFDLSVQVIPVVLNIAPN